MLSPTDPLPDHGTFLLARHVMACRIRMNEALGALGARVQPYTSGDVTGRAISASDFNEVQQRAQ